MKWGGRSKRGGATWFVGVVITVVAVGRLQGAEVRGLVLDGGGEPVTGAVVAAEQKGYLLATARTDAAGGYVLRDLLDAPTRVSVRYPGEPPQWCAPVRVLSEAAVARGARVDFAGEVGVLFTARFRATGDGKPVTEDIEVQCDGAAGLQATPVGEDGTIHYRTPPGHVIVIPRCPGDFRRYAAKGKYGPRYPCRDFMVWTDHSEDLQVNAVRLGSADVRFVGPDGQPISEAVVTAEPRIRTVTAKTDRNGVAHLEGVPSWFSLYAQAVGGTLAQFADVRTAPDSPPSTVRLVRTVEREVRFVDEQDEPIEAVRTRFYCADILVQEAISNGAGVAWAPLLRERRYDVGWDFGAVEGVTWLRSFARDPKTNRIIDEDPPPTPVVTIGRHSISGTVVNERGRPLPNTYVMADLQPWPRLERHFAFAMVDPRGRFTLYGLPDGEITLSAREWRPPDAVVVSASPAVAVKAGERSARLVLAPPVPYEIAVRVVDPGGRPIAGVRIDLYGGDAIRKAMRSSEDHGSLVRRNRPIQSTVTNRNGASVLGPVDCEFYNLIVSKAGWSFGGKGGTRFSPLRPEFTVVLEEPVSVEGRVRTESGDPVRDAEVLLKRVNSDTPNASLDLYYAEPAELRTATDGDGRFVLDGVGRSFRTVSVGVRAPGYKDAVATSGKSDEIVLKEADALRSAIGGRIMHGIAGKPAKPAEGVTVICQGYDGRAQKTLTAPDGRYRFASLSQQKYYLLVELPEVEPGAAPPWTCVQRRDVELRRQETLEDMDFTLIGGVVVSGRLLDEDGNPFPHVRVSLSSRSRNGDFSAEADAEGRWACRVPPGSYDARVSFVYAGRRWREWNRELTVTAEEPMTDIDFHLIPEERPRRSSEQGDRP